MARLWWNICIITKIFTQWRRLPLITQVDIGNSPPEIIEGSLVGDVLGDSTSRKSHMVGRTKNKDGLHNPANNRVKIDYDKDS